MFVKGSLERVRKTVCERGIARMFVNIVRVMPRLNHVCSKPEGTAAGLSKSTQAGFCYSNILNVDLISQTPRYPQIGFNLAVGRLRKNPLQNNEFL